MGEEIPVNYPQLLDAEKQRANLDEHDAEGATIATLQALSERISPQETRDLLAELPKQVRECILPSDRMENRSVDAFVERVSRLENVTDAQARDHAGALLGVLRDVVSAGELRDVFGQLPDEYAELSG